MKPALAIVVAAVGLAAGPALATERASALSVAFQHWCLDGPPDFATLDAKAVAGRLSVAKDDKTDTPADGVVESKLWTVPDEPTGAYALTGGLAVKHGRRVTLCGLAAPDASGAELSALLSRPDHFGPPIGVRNSEDGASRLSEFKSPYAHSYIILSDGTPQNAAGVILNITEVREAGR